ncbi:hypothetical protein [Petroclostridium sp. X23]|uniref:hypothetical protein n=1 Tax=Petroclostridium sp. X23 TaxID=3045146 RepID=UPI0024AD78AB|nr:hypothetical protein [Petroclostridium sp. X23]WHH58709.1 hypothetical protein QKW49_23430 [Petroclostridium sp. X23]
MLPKEFFAQLIEKPSYIEPLHNILLYNILLPYPSAPPGFSEWTIHLSYIPLLLGHPINRMGKLNVITNTKESPANFSVAGRHRPISPITVRKGLV